jgi:transposase
MRFYCGIDLHAKDCVLCVIDNKEKIHLREKVPNRVEAIVWMLRGFSQKPAVAVEATLNWYWLVDGLEEAGFKVKLAHTHGLHMITGAKVKTDPRDAFSLARLLRLDAIPEAYIYPKDRRPIRDLLRRRHGLVSLRSAAYGSMRRNLLQQGMWDYSFAALKQLDALRICELFSDPALQAGMLLALERVLLYNQEIQKVEKLILDTVADEPTFELLRTIPGVGKILGLTIFYEVGQIERFGSAKQFCSYARVVPGLAQSSSTIRRGRGSKQGNPHLKWAFMQAAGLAVRYNPGVRKFRQTHMARRRSKAKRLISLSIVAHKLAVGTYYVLKGQVPFRQELMFAN